MISCASVWAIVLRHVRLYCRDINLFFMSVYWPLLDMLTWGFLGSWIQQSGSSEFKNYEAIALLGILLWQIIGRGANVMGFAFTEELWAYNIVNLFSLPLRIADWIVGIIIFYVLMIVIISCSCLVLISLFYDVSLWYLISSFMLFAPPLFFSGIWLGFLCLQIMVLLGKRGQELGFVAVWFLMPFSGAYYPLEVLPRWGQMLSTVLPMSYVFQGMRAHLMYDQDPTPYLVKGYLFGAIYALASVMLFVHCFNRSRRAGLARLAD